MRIALRAFAVGAAVFIAYTGISAVIGEGHPFATLGSGTAAALCFAGMARRSERDRGRRSSGRTRPENGYAARGLGADAGFPWK